MTQNNSGNDTRSTAAAETPQHDAPHGRTREDEAASEGVDGQDNNSSRHPDAHKKDHASGGNSGAGRSGTEGLGSEKASDGLGSEKAR